MTGRTIRIESLVMKHGIGDWMEGIGESVWKMPLPIRGMHQEKGSREGESLSVREGMAGRKNIIEYTNVCARISSRRTRAKIKRA